MAMRPKRKSSAPLAPNGKSQYNNSVTSTTGESKVSTPDFMKTGKKNPKLWENTLLNTVKNGGITKEKPSSVNLPDLGKRSTDSATGEDDFTAWLKDKNKTLSFVKDLPNREERAFGAAIFGKEAEERAYNRSVVEEMQKIGLAPNKTQDQLFREGFYGIEEEPDYTAILKNAIKPTWSNTPQSPHMQEFVKKQSEANKSQEEFARISNPNVKFMPAPTGDYSKQWHSGSDVETKDEVNANQNITPNLRDTIEGFKRMYDFGKINEDFLAEYEAATRTAAKNANHATTIRQAQRATGNPKLNSTAKTGGKGKGAFDPIGLALDVWQGVSDAKEYMNQGMDATEAIGRSATNTAGRVVFSTAVSAGLPATCAFFGSFFSPLGTVIGGFIGHLAAWAIDYAYSDDVGDWVEENVYTTTPDEDRNLIFT